MDERKLELVRKRGISKICWGETEEEVLEWLDEKHGLAGFSADQMIAEARVAKRKAVRSRALIYLIVSGVGLAISGGFFLFQFASGYVFGAMTVLMAALLGVSLWTFISSAVQAVTGQKRGSVENH